MTRRVVKTYSLSYIGQKIREIDEKELFYDGYSIESEVIFKKWSLLWACFWGIIFLPLIFFTYKKHIKVTYVTNDTV